MKELTIEEKAKRYDEIREKAQKWYDTNTNKGYRSIFEDIFPELAKSEDERIRKFLTKCVKENMFVESFMADGFDKDEVLAWLEKQGKNNMGISEATKQKLEDNLHKALEKETPESYNEFLDEQKPVDKVEPKFKVEKDKWYVCTSQYCNCIEGRNYKASLDGRIIDDYGTEYDMHSDAYRWFRPWTIQDAKDGDVLVCESGWTCIFKTLVNDETFSSYCFMDSTKWFCETGSECHTLKEEFVKAYNGKIHPATQEQRSKLFSKMAAEGYEWDADKKELKKIEQNPAWSEDDQSNFNELGSFILETYRTEDASRLITWLEYLKDRVQPMQEWSKEDETILEKCIGAVKVSCYSYSFKSKAENWLKSLRPQNTWKPSEEQLSVLKRFRAVGVPDVRGNDLVLFDELFDSLIKLAE